MKIATGLNLGGDCENEYFFGQKIFTECKVTKIDWNFIYWESVSIEKSEHKKTKQPFYKFESSNFNASSGKKQWEIISFDIAYILFAREEWIPHLNFILNDKKELMHENQLDKLVEILEKYKIQLVASILRGKISSNINIDEYKILELSQNDKLFKF